jgi:hypothetical protein
VNVPETVPCPLGGTAFWNCTWFGVRPVTWLDDISIPVAGMEKGLLFVNVNDHE